MDTVEVGSHKFAVPGPVVFGIGSGVDANITTTCMDIAFKSGLLAVIEYFASSEEEDDGVVLFEVGVSEGGGIFGEVDGNVMFSSEFLQSEFAIFDGGMTEGCCFGEDEEFIRTFLNYGRANRLLRMAIHMLDGGYR